MRRGTLLWATLTPLLVILLVTLVLVTALAGRADRNFFLERTDAQLESLVAIAAPRAAVLAGAGDEAGLQALCAELGAAAGVRVTVVGADGRVLGDSVDRPARMENHRDRPEVSEALAGRTGHSARYSSTRAERLLSVAAPAVAAGTGEHLAVRAAADSALLHPRAMVSKELS